MTTRRNDPCPCGSGKKFKHCHLAQEQDERSSSPLHALDQSIVSAVVAFLQRAVPRDLIAEVEALDSHPGMSTQFAGPWLCWVAQFDGQSGAELFLAEARPKLDAIEREWIAASIGVPYSVLEVLDVEPGRVTLRDLLTLHEGTLQEQRGSEAMEPGLALLGRVVVFRGEPLLCGLHQRPLPLPFGEFIAQGMRKSLRLRRAIPDARLRPLRVAVRLLNRWSQAIDAFDRGPRVTDPEGNTVLFTTDRWSFAPEAREEIAARLRTLDGVDEAGSHFVVRAPAGDGTISKSILGSLELKQNTLYLATLSVARADLLVSRIDTVCAPLLGRRVRSHTDPVAMLKRGEATFEPE